MFHAPPVATVVRNRNNLSPASTIGVTSAAAAPAPRPRTPPRPRRSRRSQRNVLRLSAPRAAICLTPGRSVLNETPASVGGASLPPDSPYKCPAAVGIPDPSTARVLKNKDEKKYDEGYDSDGEIGPFFDAIADEIRAGVEIEDVDEGLPTTMGGDGTDASPEPSDNPDWFIVESDLMGLKADDLRIQIKRRGVVPRGKKGDLQNMLK